MDLRAGWVLEPLADRRTWLRQRGLLSLWGHAHSHEAAVALRDRDTDALE
jgi:hypothetical protein